MKKLCLILSLLVNYSAFGQVDYDIKAITRSYPLALSFVGTMGYGHKLWGSDSGPLYGYVRPSVTVQTSGVINGIGAQIDLFPVSFLGFYAGAKKIFRNTDDLGSYDCAVVVCDGTVNRNYFGAKLGLAGAGFFMFVDGKIEDVEMDNRTGIFAEETSTLLAQNGGDTLTQVTGILGYELTSTLSLGTLIQHSQMDKIKNKSVMSLGITRIKMDNWSFLIGAGQFHTRQKSDHFTVMGLITWTGNKGLQLL